MNCGTYTITPAGSVILHPHAVTLTPEEMNRVARRRTDSTVATVEAMLTAATGKRPLSIVSKAIRDAWTLFGSLKFGDFRNAFLAEAFRRIHAPVQARLREMRRAIRKAWASFIERLSGRLSTRTPTPSDPGLSFDLRLARWGPDRRTRLAILFPGMARAPTLIRISFFLESRMR